jgi:hypothetical protein
MVKTLQAVRFLFVGPAIVLLVFVVNLMTSPGVWWFKWAALGIGIAWVVSLARVLRAIALVGGIAAFVAWLASRQSGESEPVRPAGGV